jgi:hypothetical protein
VNYSRFLPALALAATLFTSCSGTHNSAQTTTTTTTTAKRDGKIYVVSAESAAFFRHGPQPGRAPDQTLARDTQVRLIRPSFGYSKVELVATKEQGYVSSDEIRPASSNLIASFAPPKVDPMATPSDEASDQPAVEQFNLNSNDPRLVPPPEDLPPSELPAPAPSPEP